MLNFLCWVYLICLNKSTVCRDWILLKSTWYLYIHDLSRPPQTNCFQMHVLMPISKLPRLPLNCNTPHKKAQFLLDNPTLFSWVVHLYELAAAIRWSVWFLLTKASITSLSHPIHRAALLTLPQGKAALHHLEIYRPIISSILSPCYISIGDK